MYLSIEIQNNSTIDFYIFKLYIVCCVDYENEDEVKEILNGINSTLYDIEYTLSNCNSLIITVVTDLYMINTEEDILDLIKSRDFFKLGNNIDIDDTITSILCFTVATNCLTYIKKKFSLNLSSDGKIKHKDIELPVSCFNINIPKSKKEIKCLINSYLKFDIEYELKL